jgi:hypothetical protein
MGSTMEILAGVKRMAHRLEEVKLPLLVRGHDKWLTHALLTVA